MKKLYRTARREKISEYKYLVKILRINIKCHTVKDIFLLLHDV